MTSKQTGDLPTPYGFGFSTGGGKIGHGGAYNTNSTFDPRSGLIEIFLVQHAGFVGVDEPGRRSFSGDDPGLLVRSD